MTLMPILSNNTKDPTGQDKNERSAMRQFRARIRSVRDAYIQKLRNIPRASALTLNDRYYFYELSSNEIDEMTAYLSNETERLMGDYWFYENNVKIAYQAGTVAEYTNTARQSAAYATRSLQRLLVGEQYARRQSYVKNRVFEEMKGFTAGLRADMSRVLTDGIAGGKSISYISKELQKATEINEGRANRIARTEITTAYRRARLDETEQAQVDYGLRTMMVQLSALSPTTRPTHSARHGKLFTVEEVRDWLERDYNSINCKCSFTSVLVDENNQPINQPLVDRLMKMKLRAREMNNA